MNLKDMKSARAPRPGTSQSGSRTGLPPPRRAALPAPRRPPCPPPAGDAAPRHLPSGGAAGVPARCCSAAARALAGPGAGQGALVTPPSERPSGLRGRPPRSPRPAPRPLPLRPRSSPALLARLPLGPGEDPPRAPAAGRRKVAGRGAEHQSRAERGDSAPHQTENRKRSFQSEGSRAFDSALKFPGMMLNAHCGTAASVPLSRNRHDSCFGSRAKK
nr:proline-rich protein 2-like [Mirounga angustirostris]